MRALLALLTLLAACSAEALPERPRGAAGALGGAGQSGGPSASAGAQGLPLAGTSSIGLAGAPAIEDQDGGAEPAQSCAKAEHEAMLRPLDMLVLLDQSGSMTEHEDRWTPTTSAIKRFVTAKESAGIGVGLQYFPLGKNDDAKCDGKTYAAPDVPLAELPDNSAAMVKSIDAHYFSKDNCCDAPEHQGTPTRPAVDGVMQYLRGWLGMHPDHNAVVLLATDGEPSECDDNDIDDVASVLMQAASGTPAIKTYVIGIGKKEKLETLAQAGGTGNGAFVVDGSGAMTEVQLLETLAKIRGAALRCDFAVPSGMDSDRNKINVQRGSGNAAPTTLVRVPKPEDCAKATVGGWHFDASGERIELCPEACAQVRADPRSKVKIVVGCAAVVLL